MPKGVPKRGAGTGQQAGAPVGYRRHERVAACNIPLRPHEVGYFLTKAKSDTKYGRSGTGRALVKREVEVLDVYCDRCGVHAGQDEWCPRHPRDDLPR